MQPDLFAGPVQHHASHRILARLANGGNLPPAASRWNFNSSLKGRLLVAAGLLVLGIVAWLWLQARHDLPAPVLQPAEPVAQAPRPPAPATAPRKPVEAAVIISTAQHSDAPPPTPQAMQATAATSETKPPAKQDRRRAAQAPALAPPATATANAPPRRATPVENDEDVTLLTAMLKHAKPQPPAPMTPSKGR